jgi:hypothetical protein
MMQTVAVADMNNVHWELSKDAALIPDLVGFIPNMISADDPRPLKEQIAENYAHGGGWSPMDHWKLDPATGTITYPAVSVDDDPEEPEVYKPIAKAVVRDETFYVYHLAWVCIVQKDGSFEVSRMD